MVLYREHYSTIITVTSHGHHGVSNHRQPHCFNRLFRGTPSPPNKGPVTRKMFPFDDVIIVINQQWYKEKILNSTSNSLSLRWRHNGLDSVSNHQPPGCLLNRLFRRKSKKTSKLRVTGLCAGNSPGTGEFSAQMASYAENVSIWWRHHDTFASLSTFPHIDDLVQDCSNSSALAMNLLQTCAKLSICCSKFVSSIYRKNNPNHSWKYSK